MSPFSLMRTSLRKRTPMGLGLILVTLFSLGSMPTSARAAPREPLVRVVDLDVGEEAEVVLHDGRRAKVQLQELVETRDPIRQAVRRADVTVAVNGEVVQLETGMYHLPVTIAGVQIDCPVTSGYNSNGTPEFWGLDKHVRLRLWPAGSPLIRPETFSYPVNQRWFASGTWFDNEPVDGGATILPKIYYHAGLDIGGAEGLVEVRAATEGVVVSARDAVLEGELEETPVAPRYDVVYIRDERGWYYRYSHMQSIDEEIQPGRVLQQGDRIGVLGKEGASGGWTHLHFEIKSRQPSGKWGTQAGYAFLREAYIRQYAPRILACARPRHFLRAGDSVTLDGTRSWSAAGEITKFEWTFNDGTTAVGPRVTRTYPKAGRYSEVLRVTDGEGNVDFDFALVHVIDPARPSEYAPTLHAAYAPSMDVRAGQTITFKVRAFRMTDGEEIWDFGDGSPQVRTQSDGAGPALNPDGYAVLRHTYEQPGSYLVRIERTDGRGLTAVEHLHVPVGGRP